MGNPLTLMETRARYEQLFRQAAAALARNEPELDVQLTDKARDNRRGVTLFFRPAPPVQQAINSFLTELRTLAPWQYFYQPAEFHVTVLSVIPGSVEWRQRVRRWPVYRAVLAEVIKRHPAFNVAFRGVTASPGAVLIQGFPQGDTLAHIRDELRDGLHRAGVGADLDARYKVTAAHVTAMRFQRSQPDCARLLAFLSANRERLFGETRVQTLPLIWGDWYASAERVQVLAEYGLRA